MISDFMKNRLNDHRLTQSQQERMKQKQQQQREQEQKTYKIEITKMKTSNKQ